jgi:hypothetical protein
MSRSTEGSWTGKSLDDLLSRGITLGVENYCGSQKIAIISRIVEAPLSTQ